MWFWIKHLLIASFLLAAVGFLIFGDDITFSPDKEEEKFTGRVIKPSKKTEEEKAEEEADKETFGITTSSAAKGLSNFYGKVKEELLGTNKTLGDGFVLKLTPSVYTLDEELKQREEMVQPGPKTFTGTFMNRRFRSGDTLKQILEQATEDEGMELIWRLDRDYVIKHYFQVESDLVDTVGTVAKALNSDYEKDIQALYCYKQRALVITYEISDYVKANCRQAKTKTPSS